LGASLLDSTQPKDYCPLIFLDHLNAHKEGDGEGDDNQENRDDGQKHRAEAKDEANDAEKRTAEEAEIEPIAVSPEKKAKLEEANETPAETPAEVTA